MKTILMKRHARTNTPARVLIPAGIITATALVAGCVIYRAKRAKHKEIPMPLLFQLTSPAFDAGGAIPERYTCKGDNMSPPLELAGTPEKAKSLALVMRDPDAPGGEFVHWTVWNIHPDITSLAEGRLPLGALQGRNDFGDVGYGGPCPPSGIHHYRFEVYALDDELDVPSGTAHREVMDAITNHAIGKTELVGTVSA